MIDYLEPLLEEQEDEESCFALKGRVLAPPGKQPVEKDRENGAIEKRTDAEMTGAQGTETAAGALRQSRKKRSVEVWRGERTPSFPATAPFGEKMPASDGAWLYQQLTRGSKLLGIVERGSGQGSLSLTEEPPDARSLSLPRLDRAFQRDARRYDGGFSLY